MGGLASVQASDVAISQFRFLQNLLFCHGRSAYRRGSIFLLWFSYKQLMKSLSYVIQGHENNSRSCFPNNLEDLLEGPQEIVVLLCLAYDRDLSDEVALKSPE